MFFRCSAVASLESLFLMQSAAKARFGWYPAALSFSHGEMVASKAIEIRERSRAANYTLAWTARSEVLARSCTLWLFHIDWTMADVLYDS